MSTAVNAEKIGQDLQNVLRERDRLRDQMEILEENLEEMGEEAETAKSALAGSLQVVEDWHNETHAYAFRFCDQQPCHALNRPGA